MTPSRLESFLTTLDLQYEPAGESAWFIRDPERGLPGVLVFFEESLVSIQTRIGTVPDDKRAELFEELLRLNADTVHGAYALRDKEVLLLDTLEAETLNYEEFRASLDAVGLTLAQHREPLARFFR
jgi:hypothetical protein